MSKALLWSFIFLVCCTKVEAKVPLMWNIPQASKILIERINLLDLTLKKVRDSRPAQIAFVGMSGVGKSELTKLLLNKVHDSFSVVWWFDASQDLLTQFYVFARHWNDHVSKGEKDIPLYRLSPMGVVGYVLNALRVSALNWILVFDDARSYKKIKPFLPTVHASDPHQKHVIFTSQNKNDWPKSIEIPLFTEAEAFQLITENRPEADSLLVKQLITKVGKLPFYLNNALNYMQKNKILTSDYLDKYYTQDKRMPIAQHLTFKLKEIREENPQAFELLALLSLTDQASFTHALLETYYQKVFKNFDFLEAVTALDEYSLIEKRTASSLKFRKYSVHDIVRQKTLSLISRSEITTYIQNLSDTFVDLLEMQWENMVNFTLKNPEIISQAQAVWNLSVQKKAQTTSTLKLGIILMEYHIYKSRDHRAYEKLFQKIQEIVAEKSTSLDKSLLDHFYVNSVYVRELYHNKQLTKTVGKRLETLTVVPDTQKPDVSLRAFYNHAQFHLFQGDLKESLRLLEQAAPLLEKAQSTSNINLYWYIKAWTYLEGAQYDQTTLSLDQFFATFDEEQNYVLKLYGMNMRAYTCLEIGETQKALMWCRKSLAGAKDYFQTEKSEITAEAVMIQGKAFLKQKRYQEAEASLLKSEKVYSDYFGGPDRHADQALVVSMMGEIYEAKENFKKALEYFVKARKIYDVLYGKNLEGLNDVSELFRRIAKLGLRMHREDLAQIYLKLHIDTFGPTHPGSIELLEIMTEIPSA